MSDTLTQQQFGVPYIILYSIYYNASRFVNLHFTRLFFVKYRSALAVNSPRIRFDIIKKKEKKNKVPMICEFFSSLTFLYIESFLAWKNQKINGFIATLIKI